MIELGHVTARRPPFYYSAYARVAFSDTDAHGVVYYGRYMPYFDLARTEFHRHLGGPGLGDADFAMRATSVEYHAPARFDDMLEIFVRVEHIGRTSITYDHAAYRIDETSDDVLMATAKDVKEPIEARLTYRLKYKTKDGDRQKSHIYGVSLFP